MAAISQRLTGPSRLWSRTEVLTRPSPVPAEPGIYAWYFRELPGCVDATGCVRNGDSTLLYIGISPAAPPKKGKPPSRQTLRSRIQRHFTGDASRSTLRFTLGCLLAPYLGIELRVGCGGRMNFLAGEQAISEWMDRNASVCWAQHAEPWKIEEATIRLTSPPLNIRHNTHHPFCAKLERIRSDARERARGLPSLVR